MIPAYWSATVPLFLWQVMLHSSILGLILYIWARRVRLPSGQTKRRLLTLLLLLPLVTAAVPGRAGLEFRGRLAWFDSRRLLATPIPLGSGARFYHVVLAVAILACAVTVWQELVPLVKRLGRRAAGVPPESCVALARALPGWHTCDVVLHQSTNVLLATSGWPRRPRLIVSQGALAALGGDELAAAIAHEHAHWREGRWSRLHGLFLARLAQSHSPVALWAFREYCLEVEIECDHAAAALRDPKTVGRTLLTVYKATDAGDVAARSALRKRADVLLNNEMNDVALPAMTIAAAAVVLFVVLPWIV